MGHNVVSKSAGAKSGAPTRASIPSAPSDATCRSAVPPCSSPTGATTWSAWQT